MLLQFSEQLLAEWWTANKSHPAKEQGSAQLRAERLCAEQESIRLCKRAQKARLVADTREAPYEYPLLPPSKALRQAAAKGSMGVVKKNRNKVVKK